MDPKDLRFAETHEWAHIEGDVATVGISKFAVEQLTDLTNIDLPPLGARFEAGKSFGAVDSVKAVSDLYAPLSGEVVAVNDAVVANVQLLADDPYGAGWLIKLRVSAPSGDDGLMDLAAYEHRIAAEEH